MKLRSALLLGAVVSSLAMLAGCSSADDAANDADQDLIAGTDAVGAEFDAVGMLVMQGSDGMTSLCTGTLIAPTVVLTAKHCAMRNPSKEGSGVNTDAGRVLFLIGQINTAAASCLSLADVNCNTFIENDDAFRILKHVSVDPNPTAPLTCPS